MKPLKKPINLAALIAMGVAGHLAADNPDAKVNDPSHGNMGYKLMTEDDLSLELNADGWKLFQSLTPEGKQLALEVASRRCGQTNSCKGLNACATDKNSCAGKGSCKGETKCAIGDKNLAVRLVAKKMAEKRDNLTK